MTRSPKNPKAILSAALALAGMCSPLPATEPSGPFYTRNQNPLIRLYGIPPAEHAFLAPPGHWTSRLVLDVANHSVSRSTGTTSALIDGETYSIVLALHRGLSDSWEAGIDLPWTSHQGGFLDGFIESYHDTLGLPQGNRTSRPANRLDFSCSRGTQTILSLTDSAAGPGDLRLSLARLLSANSHLTRALALRAGVKLPTGDADQFLGSGSTDFSLALCGSDQTSLSPIRLDASIGALAMTPGDVLPDQQEALAAFGSASAGWNPWDAVGFNLQMVWNSPLFHDIHLSPIQSWAAQLIMGGSLALSKRTRLDIGVAEDIAVGTAPDVVFHLALNMNL